MKISSQHIDLRYNAAVDHVAVYDWTMLWDSTESTECSWVDRVNCCGDPFFFLLCSFSPLSPSNRSLSDCSADWIAPNSYLLTVCICIGIFRYRPYRERDTSLVQRSRGAYLLPSSPSTILTHIPTHPSPRSICIPTRWFSILLWFSFHMNHAKPILLIIIKYHNTRQALGTRSFNIPCVMQFDIVITCSVSIHPSTIDSYAYILYMYEQRRNSTVLWYGRAAPSTGSCLLFIVSRPGCQDCKIVPIL